MSGRSLSQLLSDVYDPFGSADSAAGGPESYV